jgi:hypothetical protein
MGPTKTLEPSFSFLSFWMPLFVSRSARICCARPGASKLAASSLAPQSSIILLLAIALYAILKWRYHEPVMSPLGWMLPNRFYTAVSLLAA